MAQGRNPLVRPLNAPTLLGGQGTPQVGTAPPPTGALPPSPALAQLAQRQGGQGAPQGASGGPTGPLSPPGQGVAPQPGGAAQGAPMDPKQDALRAALMNALGGGASQRATDFRGGQ